MLGVLVTVAFAALVTALVRNVFGAWTDRLDPAESWGLAGLFGLAGIGLLTLFVGLIPGSLNYMAAWAIFISLAALIAIYRGKQLPKAALPPGNAKLFPGVIGLLCLLPLVGVLTPSNSMDWDSIAYHLAVPKKWLMAGQIEYVPALHHSNFPFTIDNLYLFGLTWGDQYAAKAFSWCILLLGAVWVFGAARRWYSSNAAWWSALAFVSIPVVLWESGTAYIDVSHGLYAAIAMVYLAGAFKENNFEPFYLYLAAAGLAFCVGTKYTGLQVAFAAVVALIVLLASRKQFRAAAKPVGVALSLFAVLGLPWYVKTFAYTGNPVFPFFSDRFESREWDEWRAEIYRDEQQTFGVGRTESGRDPLTLGHAVLGLAYQPGRFVNPGQTEGRGFPTGAIGFAALLTGGLWWLSGRTGRREKVVLGQVAVLLLLWFFLSQQSRYLTIVAVPLAVLVAGAVAHLRFAKLVQASVAVQAAVTAYVLYNFLAVPGLPVVLGQVERDEYLSQTLPFYTAAVAINENTAVEKVALYDEVFGYYLNKPYMWANPGHSTIIPYEDTENGQQLARELEQMGFSHLYMNLQYQDAEQLAAMGLIPGPAYTPRQAAEMSEDLRSKWRYLIADAAREGHLTPVETFRAPQGRPLGVLYRLD